MLRKTNKTKANQEKTNKTIEKYKINQINQHFQAKPAPPPLGEALV